MGTLENAANKVSTNMLETFSGAINIAPIKLSGKYKLFVDLNNDFWLDDYSGRRKKVDKNQQFLPQVANFLKTKTQLASENCLPYGAYQNRTTKSYHAPIYINNASTIPRFFTIAHVLDETIPDATFLHKYGDIVSIIDFTKIGLTNIFNEILSSKYFEYPFYFNFEDSYINVYGYSIDSDCGCCKKFDLKSSQANQPYIDVLNNRLLNSFANNGLFFPKFLNIEFEFKYVNNFKPFNNFFGFYSQGNIVDTVDPAKFVVCAEDRLASFSYKQVKHQPTLASFDDLLSTVTILDISNQIPQLRFYVHKISVNDSIKIRYPNGDVYFEYVVQQSDIVETSLNQTLIKICANASKKSGRNFLFSVKDSCVTVKSNIADKFIEDYSISFPFYFKILDRYSESDSNYYKFRAITSADVNLCINTKLIDAVVNVKINGVSYQIVDKFQYDSYHILRLNTDIAINGNTLIEIYETKQQQLIELNPIAWLDTNSQLSAIHQFDKTAYCTELKQLFANGNTQSEELKQLSEEVVNDFQLSLAATTLPYIAEDSSTQELEEASLVAQDNSNTEQIRTMLFSSPGCTAYFTPNILNIDKHFYLKNGNIDFNSMGDDPNKYSWFLINAKCPEYCKNDVRSLRYFTDKPLITSRLVAVNNDYCETIFLGVKYQLPIKYANYQFAVYLNFQDTIDIDISYKFDVSATNKTIYLKINKYLDFVDLIRGGNVNNQPLVDLSFFYAVQKSYNTKSEFLYGFKSGGIMFCDTQHEVLFETTLTRDWKIQNNGTWYICLKRSTDTYTPPFNQLFPETGDLEFYVYSIIKYKGKDYTYISMSVLVKAIKYVTTDWVWCEDIQVKFFDTADIFINKYNAEVAEKIINVKKTNIINTKNETGNIFGDYVKIATIVVDGNQEQYKLLLPEKVLSIKENYFEITKHNTFAENGARVSTVESFKFPEFFRPSYGTQELIQTFDFNNNDNTTPEIKITLFDRNQIWQMIKDIIQIDVKFKFVTSDQIRMLISELIVPNLKEYSDLNNIEIVNSAEYVKLSVVEADYNIAIWNFFGESKIYKLSRYKAPYLPYLPMLPDELAFQLPKYKVNSTLFTIYDSSFGGAGISATGLWQEVKGNVVSSLFCKEDAIEIIIDFQEEINYKQLLASKTTVDDCIILHNNYEYISKFNSNVSTYIVEAYVDWLLASMYKFDHVENELGQILKYQTASKSNTTILLQPLASYYTNFSKLKLVFIRK